MAGPPFAITRSALRHEIARRLDDLWTGTFTGVAAGSGTDTSLAEVDDFYNGRRIFVYSGTGIGQERLITDYVQSTGVLTIRPNWTTNPTAALYEIHKLLRVTDYNAFIDSAIRWLAWEVLVSKVDSTTTLTSDTFEYALPADFAYISKLTIVDADDADNYSVLQNVDWEIVGGATDDIKLAPWVGFSTDDVLKVEGQAYPSLPTADTDSIALDTECLLDYALFCAYQKLGGRNSPDQEYYRDQAKLQLGKAEATKAALPRRVEPGSVFTER